MFLDDRSIVLSLSSLPLLTGTQGSGVLESILNVTFVVQGACFNMSILEGEYVIQVAYIRRFFAGEAEDYNAPQPPR